MSAPRYATPCTDGRINLDQQRKRAKELFRDLLRDVPAAHAILLQHLPAGLQRPPRLADAQWLIARELGFASWPKLKAHIDAIDFAARHPGFAADDEASCLHLRCGNDIAHNLQLAGFRGEFRMFADPLVMGPVPDVALDEYLTLRSDFISRSFAIPPADALGRMGEEYAVLDGLAARPQVVLWCEADAYDQLFLIRVLASLEHLPQRLELIEVDRVPGVERFIGIGQLAPDLLAWLWPQRRALDEDALRLARRAWSAYCNPSPRDWAELAQQPTPALPLLGPALRRQLQELPSLRDGLSLTERLALQALRDSEGLTFGRVFAELMSHREPLPYLGDLMFHALLRPLIDSSTPLLREHDAHLPWPQRPLELTGLGRQVLGGERYWLDQDAPERWVGGVRLRAGQPHWALDDGLRPVWKD
ncbi:hypothetical protein D9M69_143850 [compost metagenome]